MKLVGSDSWFLSMSVDAMPHAALYIRDALGLDVTDDKASPPPLSHRPPDRKFLLTQDESAQARPEWLAWWRLILEGEARFHDPSSDRTDFSAWHSVIAAERARTVGEPPEFDALAGSPVLRRAVVELFPEASHWRDHTSSRGAREPLIPWEITRDVANAVAERYMVSLGRVRGVILILGVDGTWAQILKPGIMICAEACLADSTTAADRLRDVFESSLDT